MSSNKIEDNNFLASVVMEVGKCLNMSCTNQNTFLEICLSVPDIPDIYK